MRTRKIRRFDRPERCFTIRVASFGSCPPGHRAGRILAAATMPIVVLHSLAPWHCRAVPGETPTDSTQCQQSVTDGTERKEASP
jgi:hypothetical protein